MKIGIDYGTSTTLISYTEMYGADTRTDLINIGSGGNRKGYDISSVPSLIAITKKGDLFFGYDAVQFAALPEEDAVVLQSLKKCLACEIPMGTPKGECWNLENIKYCDGGQQLRLFDTIWDVKSLVRRFLDAILNKTAAKEKYLNADLDSIGISVPAIFGGEPRNTVYGIVLDIASHVNNIDVVNEPTAAIIACQDAMKDGAPNDLYAICDVGGGTTDIVLVEKKEANKYFLFKPTGIRVAGDDFDKALMDNFLDNSKGMSRAKAFMEVRRAKEILTLNKEANLFGHRLTRDDFNGHIRPVVEKIVEELRSYFKTIYDLYKPTSETNRKFHINKIFLSGGGSRIPLLASMIRNFKPLKDLVGRDEKEIQVEFIRNDKLYQVYREDLPSVVVAIGTSMRGDHLQDSIQHMLPFSIAVRCGESVLQIKAPIYTELPCEFRIDCENDSIEILAIDQNRRYEAINLTEELFANERDNMELSIFLQGVRSCRIKINEQNIMWVTHGKYRRSFNLPWQGGIEEAVFKKYRKEWRIEHGFN